MSTAVKLANPAVWYAAMMVLKCSWTAPRSAMWIGRPSRMAKERDETEVGHTLDVLSDVAMRVLRDEALHRIVIPSEECHTTPAPTSNIGGPVSR